MIYPISTGQAARILGVTEPFLNRWIRKSRFQQIPEIVTGRRQWRHSHVLRAAEELGLLSDDVEQRINETECAMPPDEGGRGEEVSQRTSDFETCFHVRGAVDLERAITVAHASRDSRGYRS
jgi:hypothetical protein